MRRICKRVFVFYFTFIIAFFSCISHMLLTTVYADENRIIGYAVLMVDSLNLGIRWDMTGGTSGEITRGEILDVYDENDINGVHRYRVHAQKAGIDGYISARYVNFIPIEENAAYAFLKAGEVTLYEDMECDNFLCSIADSEVFNVKNIYNVNNRMVYYVYAYMMGCSGYVYSNSIEFDNRISEKDLYTDYILYLNNAETFEKITEQYQSGIDALDKSTATTFFGTWLSILKNGIIGTSSKFLIPGYMESTYSHEALITLLYGLMGNKNLVYTAGSRFVNKVLTVTDVAGGLLEGEEEIYFRMIEAIEDCNIYDDVPIRTFKFLNDIEDKVGNINHFTQGTWAVLEIMFLNYEMVDLIENNANPNSLLYENIKWGVNNSQILFDPLISILDDLALDSLLDGLLDDGVNIEVVVGELALKIVGELVYRDSTDDYMNALYLSVYSKDLGNALVRYRSNLIEKNALGLEVLDSDIENYAMLFEMYRKSVEIFLDNVVQYDEKNIKNAIDKLSECTYDKYIEECLIAAQLGHWDQIPVSRN